MVLSKNQIEPRYPRHEREVSVRFTIIAPERVRDGDRPTTRETLAEHSIEEWKSANHLKITTLQNMECRDVVKRPEIETVSHLIFAFKAEGDKNGNLQKYKACFPVQKNEEEGN